MKKRSLSIALALVMCLSLFSTTFVAQAAEPTKITSTTTEWSGSLIAEGTVEINSNITVTDDAELILADGAELTVNGTIDAYGASANHMLTVSTQSEGTGVFTINGDPNEHAAYIGSITVNGGTVNITGGDGISSGIFFGVEVNVSGGILNVSGGNGSSVGVQSCVITMTGGEMNIVGGYGTTYGGYGMVDAGITMIDGVATVTGGLYDHGREKAFDGEDAWLDARIFSSGDGIKYLPIESHADGPYYLKFLPKVPTVSYIDANGTEQKKKATAITKSTNTWSFWPSWMVNLEDNTINGNLNLTDDTSIILGDDTTLTVNGSIKTNGYSLTIYTQKNGTGKLIVKGTKAGIAGNTSIYGGTISVIGGAGNPGFSSGNLTIGGKANVSISGGGNNWDYQGASGAENCKLIASGDSNVTIKGNIGAQDGGFGVKNSSAVVADNAIVTISGADKNGSFGVSGKAFGGTIGTIDASLQSSNDGINFESFDEEYAQYPIMLKNIKHIRLTKKIHTFVPYLDETGNKQTATDPKEIKESAPSSHTWEGWMIASGNLNLLNEITLTGDTNLILADGANLVIDNAILCDGYRLTIYAQSLGNNAGKLTVSGANADSYGYIISKDFCYGIKGNLTVNGGNVNVTGGCYNNTGYPGVQGNLTVGNGNVTITGGRCGESGLVGSVVVYDGKVTINAGKDGSDYVYSEEKSTKPALRGGVVTMYGGKLYINGSGKGCGMEKGSIIINGGIAIITGGPNGGVAYQNSSEFIHAKIETSTDGKIYLPFVKNNYEDNINSFYSLRLTPIMGSIIDDPQTSPETRDVSVLGLWFLFAIICLGFASHFVTRKLKVK